MQSLLQISMCVRMAQLGWHADASIKKLIILSFVPALVNGFKKNYVLWCNARPCEMGLCQCVRELAKSSLGPSAPLLTQLNKQETIQCDGMLLNDRQQDPIFQAIAHENQTLLNISFDNGSRIDLEKLGEAIR